VPPIPAAGITIRWHTPPPTSIDERLVVGPDGRARLSVYRPRLQRDQVGTYEDVLTAADLTALAGAGPVLDLDLVVPDPRTAALGAVADRVAGTARQTPLAVARFALHPLGALSGGGLQLALLVTGEGERPVEFELLVEQCAVHWGEGGREIGWQPMPPQPIGFMTPDAEGLGGVRERASVPPEITGAIAFSAPAPAGAGQVWMQVAGLLFAIGEPVPAGFEAWTAPVPVVSVPPAQL
jgi:hypothetical protein